MKKIEDQIRWYQENAARKDDELIKANLKLIDDLYGEIEHSEDRIFLDKIIGTFCEIMEIQREVIADLSTELEQSSFYALPDQQDFVIAFTHPAEFCDDKELQAAFTSYCLKNGKSSYTVNDYCSRIKNLWKSFYSEYRKGELPDQLRIVEEQIKPNSPLLNAFFHSDELNCYIGMKISASEGNRNWANTRAAYNKLDDFRLSLQDPGS